MGRLIVGDKYPLADELRGPFLTAAAAHLLTDVSLLVMLKGAHVFVGTKLSDKPSSGRWVTLAFEKPIGGVPEHNEGWLLPRLHVLSECRESEFDFVGALNFHTEIHARITTLFLAWETALAGGANGGNGQVVEREDQSDDIMYDAVDETYYFASFFSTRIMPSHV